MINRVFSSAHPARKDSRWLCASAQQQREYVDWSRYKVLPNAKIDR
jgi:hypothetical protein